MGLHVLKSGWCVVAAAVLGLMQLAGAAEPAASPQRQGAMLEKMAGSMAVVEYTLQYDKGEAPQGGGAGERCANCGSYHGQQAGESAVEEERPIEAAGWVISPTRVVSADVSIHPRFIKAITVRVGKNRVAVKGGAFARDNNAVILETAEPMPGATPLVFDGTKKGPYLAIKRTEMAGAWVASARPISMEIAVTETGERYMTGASNALVTDKDGTPVALLMNERLAADESWKAPPEKWSVLSKDEMDKAMGAAQARAVEGILRVSLSFRSPRVATGRERVYRHMSDDDEGQGTNANVTGVLLSKDSILVLANLKRPSMARLQRVMVHPPKGQPVAAKFVCTLADYGAFVARLERPLGGAVELATGDIRQERGKLLFGVEVRIQGEKRVTYAGTCRIPDFTVGWRRQVVPSLSTGRGAPPFVFDEQGRLVALPIDRRERASLEDIHGYRGRSMNGTVMSAAYVAAALAELPRSADLANVPMTEEQENQVAWMGVELQPLNKELARANNVSDMTGDGQSGALVTYVYPDSPAGQAGITAGAVLLRLHVDGYPRPVDVKVQEAFEGQAFPWEQLDQVPEQYFEQIPKPWPAVDSPLNRMLTELGFGRKYTVEFFQDGKALTRTFQVAQGPVHYDAAPKYKSERLGATVRDLTYESRRYFQFKAEDPGVIISKVEQGGKASTSGLKPFEVVTHVNGQAVKNAQDFQKLTDGQTELRLSVKRMAKGRQVKIVLGGEK